MTSFQGLRHGSRWAAALGLALLAPAIVRSQAAAPRITWSTIDAGGVRSSSGPFVLQGTVGQPDITRATAGELALAGGFWPGTIDVAPTPTIPATSVPPTTVAPTVAPTTVAPPSVEPPTGEPPTPASPTAESTLPVPPPEPSPTRVTEPTEPPPTDVPSPTAAPPTATPTEWPPVIVDVALDAAPHFAPDPIRLRVGDSVRWTNRHDVPHGATSGRPDAADGWWDSGFLDPGASFTYTFVEGGVYRYHCRVHPDAGLAMVYVTEVRAIVGGPVIFLPWSGR